jgi:hypothetical protein
MIPTWVIYFFGLQFMLVLLIAGYKGPRPAKLFMLVYLEAFIVFMTCLLALGVHLPK